METNLSNRLQATLLAIFTVGLVLLAALNFRQDLDSPQPFDGVWWTEAANGSGLVADKVLPGSPASRSGLKVNDLLTAVNDHTTQHLGELVHELYRTGPYGNAHYSITRDGIQLESPVLVIPEPADRSMAHALRVIGLI